MEGIYEHLSPEGRRTIDEMSRSREYHFLNMHVYVNTIFDDHCISIAKINMAKTHHVHIFMWDANVGDENLQRMMRLIGIANDITGRPVYVHVPKRSIKSMATILGLLRTYKHNDNNLKYGFIVEKNSNCTEFVYGDYTPVDGKIYHVYNRGSSLIISWDFRGYARPTFFHSIDKTSEEVFKD